MKVIFLDYDGVLNNPFYLVKAKKEKETFIHGVDDFDVKKVEILKQICDVTGAKVVVVSSWRNNKTARDYLEDNGIPIYGIAEDTGCRGEDVDRFLEQNDVENYLILDDESLEYSTEQASHLIYTRETSSTDLAQMFDCLEGLQKKHIGWAESILN